MIRFLVLAAVAVTHLTVRDAEEIPSMLAADPAPGDPTFDIARIAPYFTDRKTLEAVDHLRADRAAAALKLLPAQPKDPQTRFLLGLALSMTNEHARAAALFEALVADYRALAPRLHCLAADSFQAAGDFAAAARHDTGCAEDPARGRTARLERVRNLLAVKLTEEALNEVWPLALGLSSQRAEALMLQGEAHEALHNPRAALEDYRTAFVEEPLSPVASRARTRAAALVKALKVPPLSADRLAERASRLLEGNRVREAVGALKELPPDGVCGAANCPVTRCRSLPASAAGTPAVRTRTPLAAFTLATAQDDEAGAAVALARPACAVEMPAKPADPTTCRVQMLRGWAARKTRANQKALDLLRPVYERCTDPAVRGRALFLATGAAAALRDPDAQDLALLLSLQFPGDASADDALFTASAMARDAGRRDAERGYLRRLIQAHPEGDQRAEALFRLYWSHRLDGRPDRGLAALETLSKEYDAGPRSDGGDAERGWYWWGRTVFENALESERSKGRERLARLAADRPTTYYGLLARSYLGSRTPPIAVLPKSSALHSEPLRLSLLPGDRAYTQAIELWRLGLLEKARESLASVDYKPLRRDGARGREASLLVAEHFRRLGDDRAAHHIARRELLKYMRESADPLSRRASMVAYPLAFRGEVSAWATKAGFEPNFLQGLMREESALDPKARSPVGACGLTQVMPATARQVASSLGIKGFSVDHLWVPDTNIRIGSTYLGRMLKQFGHPGLAAAAYNAGPGAVKRWLAAGDPGAFDEFVEQIPFSETRGYVKRVLRSFATYDYLYETSTAMCVSLAVREGAASP